MRYFNATARWIYFKLYYSNLILSLQEEIYLSRTNYNVDASAFQKITMRSNNHKRSAKIAYERERE